jgi:hypothetical protein
MAEEELEEEHEEEEEPETAEVIDTNHVALLELCFEG